MPKIISEYREEAIKRIIQAGLEVLYEKGYCNTTMEEIARKLNVTKPALYRYFNNKVELIIASARDRQKDYRQIISSQENKKCPIDSWIEIFDLVLLPDSGLQSIYFDIISMSYRRDDLKTFSCQRMAEEIENETQNIINLQKDGLIRSDIDPKTASVTLIALFNGMRLQILLGVERNILRDTWIKNLHGLFISEEQKESLPCQECRWTRDCARVMGMS